MKQSDDDDNDDNDDNNDHDDKRGYQETNVRE